MTYPALDDFDAEDVDRSVWKVYHGMRRQKFVVHYEARLVKTEAVAKALRMQPTRTGHAIRWLIDHGYLIEKGREGKSRLLVLEYERSQTRAA